MKIEAYGSPDKCLQWQLVSILEDLEFADDIALLTHRLQDIVLVLMATNWTRAHRNINKEAILEMDLSYTEERRWKHRKSCTGVESTGKT